MRDMSGLHTITLYHPVTGDPGARVDAEYTQHSAYGIQNFVNGIFGVHTAIPGIVRVNHHHRAFIAVFEAAGGRDQDIGEAPVQDFVFNIG